MSLSDAKLKEKACEHTSYTSMSYDKADIFYKVILWVSASEQVSGKRTDIHVNALMYCFKIRLCKLRILSTI